MPTRPRTVTPAPPSETGVHDGLAYSLWLPERGPQSRGSVLILHGAGSCKESHHDFARAVRAAGMAALAFDLRGHGASVGALGERVLEDLWSMAELLRSRAGAHVPLALRGSSMGGYLAIVAAPRVGARAVVAICPPSAEALRRGLQAGTLRFAADRESLERFLAGHPLDRAAAALAAPVLLLHAEGDEQVPVAHSRELARRIAWPGSRLVTVPGGHHRSVQHDPELQAVSVRFLERALAGGN